MILVSGFLGIFAVCGVAGVAIWQLRLHEINEAKRELTTLNVLLVEETERAMQSVDLILDNVVEKLISDGVTTPEAFEKMQSGRDTYELLRSRIAGVPQLDAITVVSAAGRLINFSRFYPVPEVRLDDRDYFQTMRDDAAPTTYLSAPVRNRGTGTWTIYRARRVNGPKGEFIGLILGAIDLAYYENLYKNLQVGPGGAVSLWRNDGMLLARFPSLEGVGRIFNIQSFRGMAKPDRPTIYEEFGSIDGTQRIVATQAAKQFPLVVNVTETFGQILEDWRHVATLIFVSALLCVIAIALLVLVLVRQFRTFEALEMVEAERSSAIAARDQAEEQLRQAQKLEAVGQLTGGIAHDFNNLLTAVLGNLELLRRHAGEGDPRFLRWAGNALEAARRGANLTARLLAFSRRQPLDPRPSDVTQLLASMSDLLSRTLGENIDIKTRVDGNLWQPFVDVNQLDNAILNIAINARDAMGGRGRLSIEASNAFDDETDADIAGIVPGQFVLISIADTGSGIDKETLERVFEPFFTTKPVGQGTGLGLSQVYGFLKQSGGHIEIDSEPGRGTTVRLYLPRARSDMLAETAPIANDEIETVAPNGVILVVEDDDDVRGYSVETLRDMGYIVREAVDAQQALAILAQEPAVVLLFADIGLPGLNGRELAGEAIQMRPNLKILFTTGHAPTAVMPHGRLDRGVPLIAKPFTQRELAQKLRLVLDPSPERAAG